MLAIVNAKLYTASGLGVINKGTMLIRDGKIAAIGSRVPIPAEAKVIDIGGKPVIPGMVEAHSHLIAHDWEETYHESGGGGAARFGGSADPDIDYYYNFDHKHIHLQHAVRSGVTTASIRPGSGKIITGVGFVTKMHGKTRKDMVIKRPDGLKLAFGENPKRVGGRTGKMPATRMGTAALLREALVKAQNYMKKQEKAKQNPDCKPPKVDRTLEPLVKLLRGEIVARVHAHREDDIMTAIRIADEFGFKMSIEHATAGHKITEEIAKRGIPCVVGPTFGTRAKVEVRDKTFATPGILEAAGIKVAITTDASVIAIDFLRTCASLALRHGMSEEGVLRAVTINPAQILGVDDRIGSLEVGKDADFVIMSDYPFALTSVVEQTYVNGELAYNRDTYKEDWELEQLRR